MPAPGATPSHRGPQLFIEIAARATVTATARPTRTYRFLRDASTVAALGTLVAFVAAILLLPSAGVIVHELAAGLLLVLLAVALFAAAVLRLEQPAAVPRLGGALALLVGVAATGALLAAGAIPSSWEELPLVGLAALAMLLVDSLRVTRALRPRSLPGS